eukprot:TRINITY_DN46138_c0_g1_i1.p1 TRINITY_DN46138_c0_g1~~TRINITY_DN46138_c0_g1_i1.p1  ORF type:complete len:1350 (-),score=293.49 TRINITY_DN46138_c0_g1_i1:173-4222(-)
MAAAERASAREPFLRDSCDVEQPTQATSVAPVVTAENGGDASQADVIPPVGLTGLFRYASPLDKGLMGVGVLGAMVNGMTQVAFSFMMQDLVTSIYEPQEDIRNQKVLHNLIVFCCIGAVSFMSTAMSWLGFATAADNQAMELRRRFFNDLMHKSVGWYDKNSSAQMATRLTNDTYEFRQGSGEKLGQVVQGVAMCLAGFSVGFYRSWKLTLVMLALIPVMVIVMGVAVSTMTGNLKKQQEYYAKAGGVAETSLGSIRTVAAFGGYAYELKKYSEELTNAAKNGVRAGLTTGIAQGTIVFTIYSIFGVGFFVGSTFVISSYESKCWINGDGPPYGDCFSGGTMISTVFAVFQGGMGLSILAPNLGFVSSARAAAGRIFHVIDQPSMIGSGASLEPERVDGRIEFKDVVFSYPTRQETRALDTVSFTIEAGMTAAFVGESGSGKSTTVALLQRFYDPTGGSIKLGGYDISNVRLPWLRAQMALVQQEPVLFGGSIMSNIAYGYNGTDLSSEELANRVKDAAKAANAHHFITEFPSAYETEVGERGAKMSGGQKQRIAIARAMIRQPAVLLLDEATSALDTESERVVQEALDRLLEERRRTTLVIAHRLVTIKNADQIYLLERGKLLEQGTHNELVAIQGKYAALVELQMKVGMDAAPALLRELSCTSSDPSPAMRRVLSGEGGVLSRRPSDQTPGMRRQPSGGGPPAQNSGSFLGIAGPETSVEEGNKENGEENKDEAGVPAEDDAEVNVPVSRLLAMQRKEYSVMILALICTIFVGASSPLLGNLFSDTIGTMSMPPVAPVGFGPEGLIWKEIYDADELRSDATKTSLEYVGLGAVVLVSSISQNWGFRRAAETLTYELRKQTFQAMLRQEMAWYDARSTGVLADRLASEAPLIKSYTGESLAAVLQITVTTCTGLIIALSASWALTLCIVGFLPILTIGNALMQRYVRSVNKTKSGPVVSEAVGNMRTVAAFGLEKKMAERYSEVLIKEGQQDRKSSVLTGLASAYTSGITLCLYGGIIFVANIFITKGWMDAQDTFKVLFPMLFMASGLSQASMWLADRAKAQKALRHIFHTIDRVPGIDASSQEGGSLPAVTGRVEFKHVKFHYPTRPEIEIFTDFDLVVEPMKTVAFVGPSGSGKSTTVALLQRFYDPVGGKVLLDGQDIKTLNLAWLRSQMALVQQEPVLFAGTIYDNISYGKLAEANSQTTMEEVMAAARKANAHAFIETFPDGYNTNAGDRGLQLSGGQKQRIAIARSLIRRPAVLLLDEATSALDSESERIVQEALDRLLGGDQRMTTIVIAHRLSTIQNSDLICVIYQGQIVEKGTHSELMAIQGGQYAKLVQRQMTSDK